MSEPTTADAIWRILEDEGVQVVFGHPGGAILPVYDALHRHGGIRHVLARHEQGAAHAADGYARVTGSVGVCLATSGPGATNLVTGLATAQMDSVPLLAITGQVALDVMGTQAFQETDIVSVAQPVTKAAYRIEEPGEVEKALREALQLAREGRPGPVLVDVPKCIQKAFHPEGGWKSGLPGEGAAPDQADSSVPEALDRAADLLHDARRPVLLVGRGVVLSATSEGVRELAETLDLPVVTTLLGLDAFPARDPRALGMPGMHGSERANRAIHGADLILGLGLRFDDRVTGAAGTFAPEAAVVHFDVDPQAPGRTIAVDLPVVGDLRETLPALLERLSPRRRPRWWSRIRAWSRECGDGDAKGEEIQGRPDRPRRKIEGSAEPVAPAGLTGRVAARTLCRRLEDRGATVVTDVGQHQMWMAQELRGARPGTHLTSGGLGTMGYALPAAIGASLGRPGEAVWVVAGDGGFQMTLQELATIRDEGLPLRVVVMNNGFLGMVRQWQELFYEGRYAATRITGPDLVGLAEAYGIPARAAATTEELEEALDWTDTLSGPALVEVRVPSEENVYPMVPTGASLGQLVTGPPPPPSAAALEKREKNLAAASERDASDPASREGGEADESAAGKETSEPADVAGPVWC